MPPQDMDIMDTLTFWLAVLAAYLIFEDAAPRLWSRLLENSLPFWLLGAGWGLAKAGCPLPLAFVVFGAGIVFLALYAEHWLRDRPAR
jgi:hypothetical protein